MLKLQVAFELAPWSNQFQGLFFDFLKDSPGPDSLGPDSLGPDFPGPDSPGPDSPGPDSPGPDFLVLIFWS